MRSNMFFRRLLNRAKNKKTQVIYIFKYNIFLDLELLIAESRIHFMFFFK